MPTVRVYGQRKVPLDPLLGGRRSAAETPTSQGAGLAQAQGHAAITQGRADQQRAGAMGALGDAVAGIGSELFARGEADRREAFEAQRRDASKVRLLGIDRAFSEFTLGLHHPETGAFATVQGPASLALIDDVTAEFDKRASAFEVSLAPEERPGFYQVRDGHRLRLRDTAVSSATQKMGAYAKQEHAAAIDVSQATAITYVRNRAAAGEALSFVVVAEEIAKQEAIIASDRTLSPAARALKTAAAVSATHGGVIEALLADGADHLAKGYFAEVSESLIPSTRSALQDKIAHASTAGTGFRAADAIWQRLGPTADDQPIAIDQMEDAARTLFRDDPKAFDITLNYLRERAATVNAARKQRSDAIAGTLWGLVNDGATLAEIRTDPAYLAAPGDLQLKLSDHIVKAAEDRVDRAHTLSERAETDDTSSWARYWELSSPAVLATLSEAAILAETPVIGVARVGDLMKAKRAQGQSADTARVASIDKSLFDTEADRGGFGPYKQNQTPAEKAALGQLENTVLGAVDLEQQRKGGMLSRDEKQKVMRGLIDQRVLIDRWGASPAGMAADTIVHLKDRAAAYVPLAKIPERSLNEWVNVVRSTFKSAQALPRAEILRLYGARIQRAHAATVLKLGDVEERARLEGR